MKNCFVVCFCACLSPWPRSAPTMHCPPTSYVSPPFRHPFFFWGSFSGHVLCMKDFDDGSRPRIDFCILMQDIESESSCTYSPEHSRAHEWPWAFWRPIKKGKSPQIKSQNRFSNGHRLVKDKFMMHLLALKKQILSLAVEITIFILKE